MSEKEKKSKNANENLGLNPSHNGETDEEKIAENSPAYLSNILEQDFYGNSDSKGKNIKGMTIGLAMNSVYYYKKRKMAKHLVKIYLIKRLKSKVNRWLVKCSLVYVRIVI